MLALDDPRWSELVDGCRETYDARPLLQCLAKNNDAGLCWKQIWDRLHHQGDVDSASYAVLPYLVINARDGQRDWNLYGFAATVIAQAGRQGNPAVPGFLEQGMREAEIELFEMAVADMRAGVAQLSLRTILEFLAVHGRALHLADALGNIDHFEDYGTKVLEAERNGRN